ncbi:MAG: hypothetical protein ACO1G6_03420 [Bacteroidota bacterium]
MPKLNLTPKRKRLNGEARLKCAQKWINSYRGKNIIDGYARWFGVDKICAINELKKANVLIDKNFEMQIRRTIKGQAESKSQRQKAKESESFKETDSDETFSFIVGYTSCGSPFGLTHTESEEFQNEKGDENH